MAAVVAGAACAAAPDVTVTSGPELSAALEGASPGDVIAVDGFFDFPGGVHVRAPGVTLTCLRPGDGFHGLQRAYPGYPLITVEAPDFTLQGVTVTVPGAGDLYSKVLEALPSAAGLTVRDNALHCGWAHCVYEMAPDGRVENNWFYAHRGTQMALGLDHADRTVVVNNVMEAPASYFAGVQIRHGVAMTVANNRISGWYHGIVATNMTESVFSGNQMNTYFSGFYLRGPPGTDNNLFRANAIEVGGPYSTYAVYLAGGCGNVFEGNRITSPHHRTVYFNRDTGANVWRGDPRAVLDGGWWDCDGDGVTDPNQYPGSRRR